MSLLHKSRISAFAVFTDVRQWILASMLGA
jgi:hypothetical protein